MSTFHNQIIKKQLTNNAHSRHNNSPFFCRNNVANFSDSKMAGEDEQNEENRIPAPGAAGGAGAATPPPPTSLTLAPEVISALVAPVAFKLPEFSPQSTELWFSRAEAQFRLKGITVEQTMFDHVIAMLDNKTANQCLSILVSPPDNPYTALKQKLTKLRYIS